MRNVSYINFNSKNDFLIFFGDAQIAHAGAENPISLKACTGNTKGNIMLLPDTPPCLFDYETGQGYYSGFNGSRIVLESTIFTDPDNRYDISINIETPGVYFTGQATFLGFDANMDGCFGFGNNFGNTSYISNTEGQLLSDFPSPTCSEIPKAYQVSRVYSTNGAIQDISAYNQLFIDLPYITFDPSVVTPGTEVIIQVQLSKYPCGNLFSETRSLGTFYGASSLPAITGQLKTSIAGHDDLTVNNATISLEGTTLTVNSDETGYFTFSGVPPNSYNLIIEAPSFEPLSKLITVGTDQLLIVETPLMTVNTGSNRLIGDGNCDGKVDVYDAVKMVEAIAQKIDSFEECK